LRLQAAQALRKAFQAPTSQIFTSEYGSVKDSGYRIPAVPISKVKERYHRQIVSYNTREKPGTIIVDTPKRYLYFVLPGRRRRCVTASVSARLDLPGKARPISPGNRNGRNGRRRRR
jgi:lipoprotein-anchoring transpeptidase ErfK/SrfK